MMDLAAPPFNLSQADIAWVEQTLASMSLAEKIGQLFLPISLSNRRKALRSLTHEFAVGGIMSRPQAAKSLQDGHRFAQENSKIPLLIAGDLESGGIGVTTDGTQFGMPLQVAATGDMAMAHELGRICGVEGAAVGLNWAFSPVADIDLNFRSPITNLRTFGSDQDTVIAMVKEYVNALDEEGLAAAIKHFPGDGVDERDQHLVTSINTLSTEDWDTTYGTVYRSLIAHGVRSIMVGHIALPSYQKSFGEIPEQATQTIPATLSKALMTDLLRGQLGFNGLVITDASPMAGFRSAMKREHAIPRAIACGADMILFVRDMASDFHYMMKGFEDGVLTEERLNEALTRILGFKASLKLHNKAMAGTLVPPPAALRKLRTERSLASAAACADASVTLIKDTQHLLPISVAQYPRVYLNVLEDSDNPRTELRQKLKEKLEAQGFTVTVRDRSSIANLSLLASPEKVPLYRKAAILMRTLKSLDELVGAPSVFMNKYDLVIYVANFETDTENSVIRLNWKGFKGIGNDVPWFVHEKPTLFISLSNPYHLFDVPMMKTYINAYTNSDQVIDAVIEKIMGRSQFCGISPVDASCGRDDVMY